jgi:hypothetical protein
LEEFLSGLRAAWKEREVRPTIIAKAKPKRLRRRPDPFAAVTTELRGWFEAEPWHTSRELLERLQAQCPGGYPDGQLRTLQRRLKEVAPRSRAPNGVRNHDGRCRCGPWGRPGQADQQSCERLFQRS